MFRRRYRTATAGCLACGLVAAFTPIAPAQAAAASQGGDKMALAPTPAALVSTRAPDQGRTRPSLASFAAGPASAAAAAPARPSPQTYRSGAGPVPLASRRRGQLAPSPLVTVSYSLVQESDGNRPRSGSEVLLLFGPGGNAFIYACDATMAIADRATYSYGGGQLSFQLDAPDLKVDADFALDLSSREATMPFQVFSSRAGTSLWQEQPLGIDQGILATYNAATSTDPAAPGPAAASEAFSYAQAWTTLEGARSIGAGHEQPARGASLRPEASGATCGEYCIASVEDLGDDILINYEGAPGALVSLYNSRAPCTGGGCATLKLSPLARDPRVLDDPKVHPDSQFDPLDKTAVLIAAVPSLESPSTIAALAPVLRQRGYAVRTLLGQDGSLVAVAKILKSSPGVVIISSGGNTAGDLMTGETLSVQGLLSTSKENAAYQEVGSQLAQAGFGTLATYGDRLGLPPAYYVSEPNCSFRVVSPSGKQCSWDVAVTPTFWDWLEAKEGAGFSHSLVFVSASGTDATGHLRDAVKARAYLAFAGDVAANFAAAVQRYFVEGLSQPTHSAEDVFYNLLHVGNTHEVIYKEDSLLAGVLGSPGSASSTDLLDGWGWDGSIMVPYRGNGWLSNKVNPDQVWWMLFAARSSASTAEGATALGNCYATYWSRDKLGGRSSPFCNTASGGVTTSPGKWKNDVAYAIYLLDGAPPAGFVPIQLPPRWALDD